MKKILVLLSAVLIASGCSPVPGDYPLLDDLTKFCTHVEGSVGVDDIDAHSTEGPKCDMDRESGESFCWVQTTEPAVRIAFPKKEVLSCNNDDVTVQNCKVSYENHSMREGCGNAEINIVGAEGGYAWGNFKAAVCDSSGDKKNLEGKFSTYSDD